MDGGRRMKARNVQVHIETLVLEGLPLEPAHGVVVERALREELERLLRETGPPSSGVGAPPPPSLAAASPSGPPTGIALGAASLGRALAGEIHRRMGR